MIPLFGKRVAIWSFLRPKLPFLLSVVSLEVCAIPRARSYQIVWYFGLVWVDRSPICFLLEAESSIFGNVLFHSICGSVWAQVSATLIIEVREWFSRVAFRPGSFWKTFLREWFLVCNVVLEKVVLSRWCFVLW